MTNKKFTLIELIVSVLVISILAAIVLVQLQNFKERSIATFLQANTKEFQTAVDRYFLDNEEYPTLNGTTITIEKPQYVDVSLLVEKGYLKKDFDLEKYTTQHYKIDVFGRVWGASEPSLENGFLVTTKEDNKTFTVDLSDEINKLVIYEVINGKLVTAGEYQESSFFANTHKSVNNKIKFTKIGEHNNSKQSKIQIELDNPSSVYLVSGVDKYELETAPVGANYSSKGFKAIRGGEGEYEYILESATFKHWLDFFTVQDTPDGSEIKYQFAVKTDRKGTYSDWVDDFYSLPDGFGVKVKISMSRGENGSKPSLYSLRVLYSTDETVEPKVMTPVEEDTEGGGGGLPEPEGKVIRGGNPDLDVTDNPNPSGNDVCLKSNLMSGTRGNYYAVVFNYALEENHLVENVVLSNSENAAIEGIEIYYSKGSVVDVEVDSYLDIPKGSCITLLMLVNPLEHTDPLPPVINVIPEEAVNPDWNWKEKITPELPKGGGEPEEETGNPEVNTGYPKKPDPSDPDLFNVNWETIDDIRFFQEGTSAETVWHDYTHKEEFIVGKTRVIYRFAVGNGFYWSTEFENFPAEYKSRSLMVHAYLQVNKEFIDDSSVPDPKITLLKVSSSDGTYDIDLDRPQLYIYPDKNNNAGRDSISTQSKVNWKYEAIDPHGLDIVNVEWNSPLGTENVTYPAGKYNISARVQNADGLWSKWTNYEFTVKDEKPVAQFEIEGDLKYIPINEEILFDTSKSIDPDGDEIVDYEWKNKKQVYSNSDAGLMKISLRVKDSENNWSDWTIKEYPVVDPEQELWFIDNVPVSMTKYLKGFDNNLSSFVQITSNEINAISWGKDITGRTLEFNLSAGEAVYLIFSDKDGNILPTLSDQEEYSIQLEYKYLMNKMRVVIPKNAVSFKIKPKTSSSTFVVIDDIRLIDENLNKPSISNVIDNSDGYSHSASFEGHSDFVKHYVINSNNKLVTTSVTNSFKVNGISANTEETYKIISVDTNFNASELKNVTLKSKEVGVEFFGLGAEAFDKSTTSRIVDPKNVKITWSKDIGGQSVFLNMYVNGSDRKLSFLDENGNKLTFNYDGKSHTEYKFSTLNTKEFVIPNGAVSMIIDHYYSGSNSSLVFESMYLLEE